MFELTVNDTPYTSKPSHSAVGFIKSRLQLVEFNSVLDFVEHIETGRSFQLATFVNNQADNEHWKAQQVFAVDFDNTAQDLAKAKLPCPVRVSEVLLKCQQLGLNPNIVYHTFSHSPALEKFRVVFIVDEPIYDKDTAAFISKTLTKLFPGCDTAATKDTARLYFGTCHRVDKYDEALNEKELFVSVFLSHTIANDGGRLRHVPKVSNDLTFERPRTLVTNFNYADAASKIKIFADFENGEWLHYRPLFGILCNLACIEGGLLHAQKVMARQPNYDGNAWAAIANVRKYGYKPRLLEDFSPYEEDHQYRTIANYNAKKHIVVVRQTQQDSNKLPLKAAEAHMKRFLDTFQDAPIHDVDAEDYQGENLYIMMVPTGIGKTRQLRERFAGTPCTIAFPYHTLLEEFYETLSPAARAKCTLTPALPEFSPALKTHIDRLYTLKLNQDVHPLLNAIVSCKKTKNYKGPITAQDRELAIQFRTELNKAYSVANTTVLTTHNRGVYTEFPHSKVLIYDEDPICELYKMGNYDANNLLLLTTNPGDFGREAQSLYYRFRASVGVEKTPVLAYLTKETLLKWYGEENHEKGAELIDFVNSTAYIVDKGAEDDLNVRFVSANPIPHNRKVLICSATVNIDLYKIRYPKAHVLDITNVEMEGKQIQHLNANTSVAYMSDPTNLKEYKELVGSSPVITYKRFVNEFENGNKDVYAFKSEGTDKYKGSQCVVLATPRKPTWFYLLRAFAFGVNDLKWNHIYDESNQIVNWNGVEFRFVTFNHPALQTIQLADIEAELLQLTGRMRALREPEALVHLCSHVPVRNFEYDTTKRRNLPVFQLTVRQPRPLEDVDVLPDLGDSVREMKRELARLEMMNMIW